MSAESMTEKVFEQGVMIAHERWMKAVEPYMEQDFAFSAGFEGKMRRLIRSQELRRLAAQAVRAAAIVLFALITGVSVWLSFDVEARADMLMWVRDIYANKIVYRFTNDKPETDTLPLYELSWMPEGFECIDSMTNEVIYYKCFSNEETGDIIAFEYASFYDGIKLSLLDDVPIVSEKVTIGKFIGDYYLASETSDLNNLVWIDEDRNMIFVISSTCDKNTILMCAGSIETIER